MGSTESSNRIAEALTSKDPAQRRIAEVGCDLIATLLRKNHDYGSSAWQTPVLMPGLSPGDAILVRMSDKIARLQTLMSGKDAQVAETTDETMHDLVNYGVLWLAKPEESTGA